MKAIYLSGDIILMFLLVRPVKMDAHLIARKKVKLDLSMSNQKKIRTNLI